MNTKDVGLGEFSKYFAANSRVSNLLSERVQKTTPAPSARPMHRFNRLETLMLETQSLPVHPAVSVTPVPPLMYSGDTDLRAFNVWLSRREMCGCGGVSLPIKL